MNKPCSKCDKSIHFSDKIYSCKNIWQCEKYKKYQKYLDSKRKYIAGEPIYTIDDLLSNKLVWFNDKPVNICVITNNQFAVVMSWLSRGILKTCVLKEEKNDF